MRVCIFAETNELRRQLNRYFRKFAPDADISNVSSADITKVVCGEEHGISGFACSDMDMLIVELGQEEDLRMSAFAELMDGLSPRTGIVFVANDDRYALDALHAHAQGYLVKPVSEEDLRSEYDFYKKRNPARGTHDRHKVEIRDGNGFDFIVDGVPIRFKRNKSRELMKYLMTLNGNMADDQELLNALWGSDNMSAKSYLRTTKAEIVNILRDAGCGDVIVKYRGRIGILPDRLDGISAG